MPRTSPRSLAAPLDQKARASGASAGEEPERKTATWCTTLRRRWRVLSCQQREILELYSGRRSWLGVFPPLPLLPRNEGVIFFWLSSPSQSAAAAQQNQKKQPRKRRPWHMTSGRSVGPHGPGAPRGRTRAAAKELLGRLAFGPALVPRSLSLSFWVKRDFSSLSFFCS